MSKGILNNRDKMIWDNTHKPEITDVVGVVDDEMDDLLEDHDDKVVDIVGDNMNDLLDAHDDKVVSIVGDNMSTLLTGAASTVQQLSHDLSGIGTTNGIKVGKWDATHDIYAKRYTGTFPTSDSAFTVTLESQALQVVFYEGFITRTSSIIHNISNVVIYGNYDNTTILQSSAAANSGAAYDFIMYYLVSTATT